MTSLVPIQEVYTPARGEIGGHCGRNDEPGCVHFRGSEWQSIFSIAVIAGRMTRMDHASVSPVRARVVSDCRSLLTCLASFQSHKLSGQLNVTGLRGYILASEGIDECVVYIDTVTCSIRQRAWQSDIGLCSTVSGICLSLAHRLFRQHRQHLQPLSNSAGRTTVLLSL